MIHHYITWYYEGDIKYAEAWIQIDFIWLHLCLSRKKIKV